MFSQVFNEIKNNIKRGLTNQKSVDNKNENKNKVPIFNQITGKLYGIDMANNKSIETKKTNDIKPKKETFVIDEPKSEGSGEFYEERKKIIFSNLMDNDFLISQFIVKTQNNLYMKSKIKSSYFYETTVDIYNIMISFKEAIANYCLVIKLYLMRGNYNKGFEIFLLFIKKNLNLFEYIYKKIKEQFPKITNSNRIGKYFPLIIRKYFEILSCLIKITYKLNKPKIHNIFMKYYIKTFYIVLQTVSLKFGIHSNIDYIEINLDIKNISNYLYSNIYFDIGIFYFIKYNSFSLTIKTLEHVLYLYKNIPLEELSISEKILLLKTNYNLGLFLFISGQSTESIQYIMEAKNILITIKFLPMIKEYKSKRSGSIHKIEKFEDKSLLTKLSYNKNNNADKIKLQKKNKKNLEVNKNNIFRKSSGIVFGNQINDFQKNYENIEEKIYNEIELLLAEIKLSINYYKDVLEHINRLLKNKYTRKRSGYSKIISSMEQSNEGEKRKEKEENFCNYSLLNDFDKRKIMFLLCKMEEKNKIINNSTNNIYKYNNFKKSNSKKISNSKDMEKFFLFICELSEYQLKILNESQPKTSNLRNDLPIIITNQFKDCLTNTQRKNLALIETMNLSRYLFLKKPNDDIYLDNFDFSFLLYNMKQNKNNKSDISKNINIKSIEKLNRSSNQRNKFIFSGQNFINTGISGDIIDKNEKNKFENILDEIKDDNNQKFIEIFKERIINVLINLNDDEKQLVMNSKSNLRKLVENIEQSLIIKK